jgi:hypothetical protein
MVGLATGIATLAVAAPLAGAGTCADGYCFVSMSGADTTGVVADGITDDYWRERQPGPAGAPSVPATRPAPATGTTFDWGDFGIGTGVGVGSMLMLAGMGVLVLGRGRRTSSTGLA